MKKFVNFTVKTSVSASTFCHFHISVVGSYLRKCALYTKAFIRAPDASLMCLERKKFRLLTQTERSLVAWEK